MTKIGRKDKRKKDSGWGERKEKEENRESYLKIRTKKRRKRK